jgi:WD40 repeat protein/class 3 adenylate cyclase/energy-coupling factor transporter ATP-binding protein EcfA2
VRTILRADIRGYTAFTRARGDEAAAALAARLVGIGTEAFEARGGELLELRGDELIASFRSPRQALRAAVETLAACAEATEGDPSLPLAVGIGIDAGEIVSTAGHHGRALNLAARLAARASAGEILASSVVVHMAGPVEGTRYEELPAVDLKGFDEPVELVRVCFTSAATPTHSGVGQSSATPPLPAQLDPPSPLLAGRERELAWLRGSWREARRGRGRALLLAGAAGMGKTRLAAELARQLAAEGAPVLYASCRGEVRAVQDAVAVAAAAEQPCLAVVDDLDVAGAETIATLEELAGTIGQLPLLLLMTFSDERPARAVMRLSGLLEPEAQRRLTPLGQDEVRQVASMYAGELGGALAVGSLLETTAGVPQRVHEVAREWAGAEVTRRLDASARRAARRRSDLRELEHEVAGDVVDLQLVRERSRAFAEAPELAAVACPFRGLAPFGVGDADYFFGRERLVAEVLARLAGAPLLGIIGPSGSGKSSAVRAGVLAAVAAGMLPGSDGWRQVVMRPGEDPFAELAIALGDAGAGALERAVERTDAGSRLVLVVDQFEELFTVCRSEQARASFIAMLCAVARSDVARIAVIPAIRADHYGRCAAYPELAALLGESHVLIGPMTTDELRRAIELPARRAGLQVEPELTEALVDDVAREPGGLPLLSSTLLELWEQRRGRVLLRDAYEEMGGVKAGVARLADGAYERLSEVQRQQARRTLLRLAHTGEDGDVVRRRVPLAELDAGRDEDTSAVLAALTERRLLTVSEGTVELAHEALFREWPRLRQWLDEDAEGRRLREHVTRAAGDWVESGRDGGELYRGARLESARDWAAARDGELNAVEREFLAESRRASETDAERQRRANRRLRGLLAGAAALLVVAIVAGGLALVQGSRARHSATQADAERLGAQALTESELDRSLLLARQGVQLDDSLTTRSNLLSSLLRSPAAIGVMHGQGFRTLGVDASPDGKTVAVADNNGKVVFLDAATGRQVAPSFTTPGDPGPIHFSPDGTQLAILGGKQSAKFFFLIDVRTHAKVIEHWAQDQIAASVAFSPDGRRLAFTWEPYDAARGPWENRVETWDTSSGRRLAGPVTVSPGWVGNELSGFTPGGRLVTFGSDTITVREPATLRVTRTVPLLGVLWVGALAPDGRHAAYTVPNGSVYFVDLRSGRIRKGTGRHTAEVQWLEFSPDSRTLASAGDDSDVLVWDVATATARETFKGQAGRITQTAFSPDGRTLYSGGTDGAVIVWDVAGDRRLGRTFRYAVRPPGDLVPAEIDVDPSARTFATPGGLGSDRVHLWSTSTLARVGPRLEPVGGPIRWIDFSADGHRLVAMQRDRRAAVVYDPHRGTVVRRIHGPREDMTVAALNHAGGLLAMCGTRDVYLFDVDTGALVTKFPEPGPDDVAFSPDDRLLAFAQNEGTQVDVYRVSDRRRIHSFKADDAAVTALAFSPDGRTLASAGANGVTRLWDLRLGRETGRPLGGHAGFVLTLGFDRTGERLISSGSDGRVRLWDVATQRPIGTGLPAADNLFVRGVFTPDGKTVIGVSEDGTGRAWSVDPAEWRRQACSVAGRPLTREEWSDFLPDRPYSPACGG